MPRVETALPAGAMYSFFRVDGVTDTLDFCKRLVREAKLGLARNLGIIDTQYKAYLQGSK